MQIVSNVLTPTLDRLFYLSYSFIWVINSQNTWAIKKTPYITQLVIKARWKYPTWILQENSPTMKNNRNNGKVGKFIIQIQVFQALDGRTKAQIAILAVGQYWARKLILPKMFSGSANKKLVTFLFFRMWKTWLFQLGWKSWCKTGIVAVACSLKGFYNNVHAFFL